MPRERRPPDERYYGWRSEYFRQGDLFTEVPLGQPWPPNAVDHKQGSRKFISGPFEAGFGLLLTPTCSMAAQGVPGAYAHPNRTLAPVLPLSRLLDEGAIKRTAVADLRRFDHLVNYLYLPAIAEPEMPESVALLYAPITLHHDYLSDDRRVAQLSEEALVHLKRQLVLFYGGQLFSHSVFAGDN
jgi:hypothetical protein